MHRDRHQRVAARPRAGPASGDRPPERLGEALLAGVLELVERRSDDPDERRAPLELEEIGREVRGQSDRDAGRQVEPGVEGREAGRADRVALPAAAGAPGGKREIEGAAEDGGHALMVRLGTYRGLSHSRARP